jgi:signal transduction histidine kinase
MTVSSYLLQLIEAASLLVLGAMAFAILGDRLAGRTWARQIATGLCLALAALTSMADPLVWRPGFHIDARAAAIILAGPFGGPGAVAVVVALTAAMRTAMGGAGLPTGLVGIGVTGLGALVWWWVLARERRPLGRRDLHAVAATSAVLVIPAVMVWAGRREAAAENLGGMLAIMAVNIGGTELLGILLIWLRERRDVLARLTVSESQLRVIADNLPGAIYRRHMAPDGTVTVPFISEGVREVVGLTAEAIVADPGAMLRALAPADATRFESLLAESARDLTAIRFQGEIMRTDGRRTTIRSFATPTRAPGGATIWNGVILDVTEQVRLEGALHAASDSAERATEAQSRFLAFITHEFRSPLNAINGYAELAAMSPLLANPGRPTEVWQQAQLADYLATIRLACEHLTAMTDDLLDLGKAEAGRLTIDLCWLDLGQAVEQAATLVRRSAATRDVAFQIDVAAGHRVFADPRRLQQILLNLTTNAVKYSHRGGRVTIRAEAQTGQDVVTIEDQGIGMNPAQLEIALEAYGQVDNSLNRVVAGTGLGLPLVKQLVELHGGGIALTSLEGSGTRVTITLPRPSADGDAAMTKAA